MKTKLMAYCVAMDENGTLWVATRGPKVIHGTRGSMFFPQWERLPLVPCCSAFKYPPVNALLVGKVLRKDGAVDSYIMTESQLESVVSSCDPVSSI